ncbi:hypothetical protein F5141DRAFT_1069109 [Pisolithus sp. B1]|nr:hypothetical protein F5141DRAFT_1069109 [Pisolithus sp. B1]
MPPENQSDSVPGVQSTTLPTNCARERSKSGPSLPHPKEGGRCCTSITIVNIKGMVCAPSIANHLLHHMMKDNYNILQDDLQMSGLVPLTNHICGDLIHQEGLPQEEVWENFWKNIKQADFLISHPISKFTPPGNFPIKKLALSPAHFWKLFASSGRVAITHHSVMGGILVLRAQEIRAGASTEQSREVPLLRYLSRHCLRINWDVL